MEQLTKVLTLYTDNTGQLWVKWSDAANPEYVDMMKAQFGAFFKEIPNDSSVSS